MSVQTSGLTNMYHTTPEVVVVVIPVIRHRITQNVKTKDRCLADC